MDTGGGYLVDTYGDSLFGGSGNDTLIGGAGADALNGGSGFDIASYAGASVGVTASLANTGINTQQAAGDTYTSIEGLIGTTHWDVLVGNAAATASTAVPAWITSRRSGLRPALGRERRRLLLVPASIG